MQLPPIEEVQPFVQPRRLDVWSMAVGIGPIYAECLDLRISVAGAGDRFRDAVISMLARRAAGAVADALSPAESPESMFALSERYRAEMMHSSAWSLVVSEIMDICGVRAVMER